MGDNNHDRWSDQNRWAGEADYGQQRDEGRGYREGRYAGTQGQEQSRGSQQGGGSGGGYRGGMRPNQDIGYGQGSLANGGPASTRAPGSFADYGASSSGGYGDGYGAYSGPADRRADYRYGQHEDRSYERTSGGYGAERSHRDAYGRGEGGGRYDDRSGGQGAFATDELLDRQARGEDRSFWGRMFGRDRHEGEHRGRGPKDYKRSDERICDDVNDRLTDDSWLDAQNVNVTVSSCEVTLNGTVASREDKRRAEELAESVSGVKHVQNNLRVASNEQRRDANREDGDDTTTTPLPQV